MNPQVKADGLFWEQFRNFYPVKAIALAVIVVLSVVSCGREASLSAAMGDLNYDDRPVAAPKPKTPAERLHVSAIALAELFATQTKRDLSGKERESASKHRVSVSAALSELKKQFRADRQKLGDLDAKAALKRLGAIESKTKSLEASLATALVAVPSDGTRAGDPAAKAARTLAALSPEKDPQPLSSELAFGVKNAKPRSPSLSAGITPAYSTPTTQDQPSDLPRTPEPADLSETPETKVTPAIEQQAEALDHDPVKIHNYVYNNIKFEPYYGIRKGADQTLAEKVGSDADQAALLIALLRESGIHARFVHGVAELPADRAANWLEVDIARGERIDAVPEILWSGGIPTSQVKANGELKRIRFSHIWAEAYVALDSYRGVDEGLEEGQWLALDPSIKRTEFTAPSVDLKAILKPSVSSWSEDFADGVDVSSGNQVAVPSQADTSQATENMAREMDDALRENGIDENSTLEDLIGSRSIDDQDLTYLPSTTPFRTLSVSNEHRSLPSALHANVAIQVSGADPLSMPHAVGDGASDPSGFRFSANTNALAGKRITLAYVPASDHDADIVDAYHGLLNAPSYAASLIPVLRVDGQVVGRGSAAVGTGYSQNLKIVYRMPGYAADAVENPVAVGSLSALTLNVGRVGADAVLSGANDLRASADSGTPQNVLTDGRGGELLSQLSRLYFMRNQSLSAALEAAGSVHATRQLSGAIAATDLRQSFVGGFPVASTLSGLYLDVDRDAQSIVATSGESEAVDNYARISGIAASSSESAVFEYAMGIRSASTASVFSEAQKTGVAIHYIDSENASSEIDSLQIPASVKQEIADAASVADTKVLVPAREIQVGQWLGTGYIVIRDGARDFRVVGGASGGVAPFSEDGQTQMNASFEPMAAKSEKAAECETEALVALLVIALIFLLIGLAIFFYGLWLAPMVMEVAVFAGFFSMSVAEAAFHMFAFFFGIAGIIGSMAWLQSEECESEQS